MNNDKLVGVLEKLCAGDTAAAEQTFRAYEPFLRTVVRRQLNPRLRAKFDSIDIVQSVWADLLQGFREADWSFHDTEHLKAFLVQAVRHRFIDHVRHHRTAMDREEPASQLALESAVATAEASPSEVARAADLWARLLAECPAAHRELLRLKRQGFSMPELAARTGLHEDSIRRILRQLASKLALGS